MPIRTLPYPTVYGYNQTPRPPLQTPFSAPVMPGLPDPTMGSFLIQGEIERRRKALMGVFGFKATDPAALTPQGFPGATGDGSRPQEGGGFLAGLRNLLGFGGNNEQ